MRGVASAGGPLAGSLAGAAAAVSLGSEAGFVSEVDFGSGSGLALGAGAPAGGLGMGTAGDVGDAGGVGIGMAGVVADGGEGGGTGAAGTVGGTGGVGVEGGAGGAGGLPAGLSQPIRNNAQARAVERTERERMSCLACGVDAGTGRVPMFVT